MQKADISILIVEDDQSLGAAMKEALTRAGYKAVWVGKPDEALNITKLQPVNAMIIDCMLPKMNGRDLAKKINEDVGQPIPLILISGIYRDKNFVREAIQSTGASTFLTKPFDLRDLINAADKVLEPLIDVQLAPLQSLLTRETVSYAERIRVVNESPEMHGYDLPLVYSLLMHPKVSGHLNIVTADGETCGLGFLNGNIVQVTQKDAKSYFGVLMVEYGFITQDEIEEVMKVTGRTKKMGERLVEANVLSPHAISIVMTEQQGIRLGRTISETSLKVNFIDSDDIREDAVIDRAIFFDLLNEWMTSKLKIEWIKSFYISWMRYSVKRGPEYKLDHPILKSSVVAKVPDIVRVLQSTATLEEALHEVRGSERDVYCALHILIISRVLRFGEPNQSSDHDARRKRLEKLDLDLEGQDYFLRLGVSRKAKDVEIKRSYHELAKILHPDKLSQDTPADVRNLAQRSFEKISKAYETLSDPRLKDEYIKVLEKGTAEAALEAEQLKENAKTLLTKGDYRKAREAMERAVSLCPPTASILLILAWAKLKSPGQDKIETLVAAVKDQLGQIPPEDRHSPTYYFVKGLHLKMSNDLEGARRSLAHAVSIDPDFIDARRELSVINSQSAGKSVNILSGDLKDVVGLLFKKKK